jgi:N-acylglucosamine 2-epimerase
MTEAKTPLDDSLGVDLGALAGLYRGNLLNDVIPFWERHSIDRECGGYFNCLDRAGKVFDTDKFLWLQGRQVWTFSVLYRNVEARPAWLQIARHGAEFLKQHGRDSDGNWYFSLTRQGQPLVQPYNWFTDCFAAMGFAQYALAAGDQESRDIALATWRNILLRRDNPKGKYTKAVPGTRPMKSMAMPMILINLALEMEGVVAQPELDRVVEDATREIMTLFYDHERRMTWDNVAPDGSHPDCFEGRLILPGHGIETMWIMMEAERRRACRREIIYKAVDAIINLVQYGWDPRYGGIFYYLDIKGHAPEQLQWDQKLWWVHVETLVALAMAWSMTGRSDCREWYRKVHEWTWSRYPDPEHGEWFAYLNRQGERLFDLKGGKWKCCYHVPRALYLCAREFEQMRKQSAPPGIAR